jgi:hypothetical protein
MSYDFFQSADGEGGQGIGGFGIATIVILFAIAIFVFIFVGALSGTVYSVVEPKISSVGVTSGVVGETFTLVNGTSHTLSHDRVVTGSLTFVLNK